MSLQTLRTVLKAVTGNVFCLLGGTGYKAFGCGNVMAVHDFHANVFMDVETANGPDGWTSCSTDNVTHQ
jgi:hypothetical protein